ncbi:DNA repair protein RecO [Weissella diestrammenae]|uniref:DNA repair protein RecO n=1 Tax=Weissella diestrammenae TaxID=1162633 RepID=A0A7G9T5X7_9LACO|nr:DNA repair protein RecO [Weissella diestrammenae]MCM0582332.1 DNA repair protein RecO [Weissella diestrammenae]QNN75502.1 DNA repair protein RecO [Weissella diestrammenae]
MVDKREITFDGIVMYQREHKERDLLVKILTRNSGKKMFFIKNGKSKSNRIAAELQPLTQATYEGILNQSGLSFVDDVKAVHFYRSLVNDIEKNAYATYILGLIDSAFVDNQPITLWFDRVQQGLEKIADEFDAQGIANYFEIALLPAFGLSITWQHCVVCGRSDLPMDFSEKMQGTICQNHFGVDANRMQVDSRAILVLSKLAQISLSQLGSLELKETTKKEMARVLDRIYDEQVGVHLKSKTFIQQLGAWQSRLRDR